MYICLKATYLRFEILGESFTYGICDVTEGIPCNQIIIICTDLLIIFFQFSTELR